MKPDFSWMVGLIFLAFHVACTGPTETGSSKASLIPKPQSVEWSDETFDLGQCTAIAVETPVLEEEGVRLQRMLEEMGHTIALTDSELPENYTIALRLDSVEAQHLPAEAYRLQVKTNRIDLIANTPHGIFNGLQTLAQLITDGKFVQGCDINDFPAYQWRGYMVDVGRNYQSIELLKQQIDQMARYKLNVFHFHLTEDVAWRLQIDQYPQLTDGAHMTRNKGMFYSIEQLKELIEYCKEQYITLVPEIDMPGHSAAFTRAMGVNMQSEKGFEIVKNIVEEVCETYDVPYLHIGADEVRITNQQFLPEITALIQRHGKTVIGWAPGGNYSAQTIHQLWKEEGDQTVTDRTRFIDSKFLYISDFDPMNSVVTIFNRQLGGKPHGDSTLLGAEFCLWADRRAKDEAALMNMNPVYPAMLAFSERSWQGGGYPGVVFSIGPDSSERATAFADFEQRLLAHKEKYFSELPFNYVKQTHIKWKLFGPFENQGNLSAAYWPEQADVAPEDSAAAVTATGGTVWLWHTHGPPVQAWLPSPKENTTWYAYTRFWSDADTTTALWVDSKDQSKSGADATPPKGEWDYMKSKIWLNGNLIPPPEWSFPGRPSGQLEDPLADEGFYYRPPVSVSVQKGWNTVLMKLPMGSFDPLLDWQVPPKWMFTFVPVHKGKGINYVANDIKFEP
ncbi:family 20 glycosylhydrolase [Parapedobacter sp. GCM10030251]|uniref:family 20 glycosylhydrolase n=1 Tax=Parapedobacter sp. GCM10030251 TaxID=3273419 RepID=UPI0036099432